MIRAIQWSVFVQNCTSMKLNPVDQVEDIITKLWKEVDDKTILTFLPESSISNLTYERKYSETKKPYVPGDFVMVDPLLLSTLKPGELKVVVQIIAELELFNPFWECNYREAGGKLERTISKLRKKNILLDTGNNEIHFVNPWLIKRGNISTVLAAAIEQVRKVKSIDKKLVKKLKAPSKSKISVFKSLLFANHKKA